MAVHASMAIVLTAIVTVALILVLNTTNIPYVSIYTQYNTDISTKYRILAKRKTISGTQTKTLIID